ncbi:hypothetical protein WJX74_010863 [Apatococcus lobatus]|uniref:Protein yippee-like n=1 Tax=Apatococcus lobatus TaxID=904363 RepID=A0AAW1Q8K1_9CHLO
MGRLFLEYLEGKVYACSTCGSHLASATELVSKSFHSKNGKAYLFNLVVNVCQGPKEERLMTTGLHHVADLQCTNCKQLVGWKYEQAFEKTQKYKEGKCILERTRLDDCFCSHPTLSDSECEDTCMLP